MQAKFKFNYQQPRIEEISDAEKVQLSFEQKIVYAVLRQDLAELLNLLRARGSECDHAKVNAEIAKYEHIFPGMGIQSLFGWVMDRHFRNGDCKDLLMQLIQPNGKDILRYFFLKNNDVALDERWMVSSNKTNTYNLLSLLAKDAGLLEALKEIDLSDLFKNWDTNFDSLRRNAEAIGNTKFGELCEKYKDAKVDQATHLGAQYAGLITFLDDDDKLAAPAALASTAMPTGGDKKRKIEVAKEVTPSRYSTTETTSLGSGVGYFS